MVKISVISDLHLGFKKGTKRGEDAFTAANRAFEKAKELDSDLIILAGDTFDSRFPRPEHWSGFIEMLSTLQDGEETELVDKRGKGHIPEACLRGIPVVAIHGTHERRGGGMMNSIEGLERAGSLIHLHCASVSLKIGDDVVAIHGMSGVPEKYSKQVLKKWDPDPSDGAYNIFLIHQDLQPYIFNPANPPNLGLEDLPQGFDCYVSGHIHWKEETEIHDKPFLIPGSLIPTQLKKRESEEEKGFYFLDTETGEIEFVEVEPPRKFFYEKVEVEGESMREIEKEVRDRLEEIFSENFEKKPLVRIKIAGELPKGVDPNDLNLGSLKGKYGEEGIITISNDLEEAGTEDKIQMLRDMRSDELSVDEMGMKILREQLEEMEVDITPEPIFDELVGGNVEKVMKDLLERGKSSEGGEESKEEEGMEKGKTEEVEEENIKEEGESDSTEVEGGSGNEEWWKKSN